jgi:ATP-binding cassette subfamily B multidrug efflux pump
MNPILRLRFVVKPYLPQILVSLISLAALTGLSLIVPGIMQQVIDDGISRNDVSLLVRAALLLLGLGLMTAVLNGFQRYISEWIGGHIGYDIRNRLYDHIQGLSFSFHDHAQTGQLISRCIEDVRSVQQFIGSSIVELAQMIFLLFGALGIMLTENWQLTLIAVLPIFPLVCSLMLITCLVSFPPDCRRTSRGLRWCVPLRVNRMRSSALTRPTVLITMRV